MRIISLFRDYYDGAVTRSQVDEAAVGQVTYRRDRIPAADNIVGSHLRSIFKVPQVHLANDHLTASRIISSKHKWLCVCGRVFMIVPAEFGPDGYYHILSETRTPDQYKELTRNRWFFFSGIHQDEVVGFTDPDILGLSVLLKSPVFVISRILSYKSYHEVHVEIEVPRLAPTGLAELYEDHVLYNDIESFLTRLQTNWKML